MTANRKPPARKRSKRSTNSPSRILAIDIGGSKVKLLASGETEPRRLASGKRLTPVRLAQSVKELADDWKYDAVSIGYPGQVGADGPRAEPGNLGPGWVGFDFAAAFERPVRIINDAAMQALGSYDGGRMLFLGLGTGLGSALVAQHSIISLELGSLHYQSEELISDVVGRRGLKRLGKNQWRDIVIDLINDFATAFVVDYVVVGGGNAKLLKDVLPPGARLGHNQTAFRGGFRLWSLADVQTLDAEQEQAAKSRPAAAWRVL